MDEYAQIALAITTLEQQRSILGDAVVDAALAGLRQKLQANSPVAALPPSPSMAGERKLVTVMFADISGFTALSERLDPEHVRSLMNRCFNVLVPIVEQHGGVVDKFIGDEIMALFGAPISHENDAERALRAALTMKTALQEFNRQANTELQIHFGINTGLAVAGGLGSEGRQQYSVMGDTVNLAARLEDASNAGEILVGPNTQRLMAALFEFIALAPIPLKGKSEPVQCYLLQDYKTHPLPLRGIAGLHSVLVGRDQELAQLQATLVDLKLGNGNCIAICGEPGIGKSRLIAELHQSCPTGLHWAEGRAQSFSEGMSYWIIQRMLDNLLGVSADLAPAEIYTCLRQQVSKLFPIAEAEEILLYLANLRELPLEPTDAAIIKHVFPEAVQQRMWQAFRRFVEVYAQQQPLVLVWEDLHWAAPSSLGLIESLLPLTTTLPLCILLIFRPQEGQVGDWYAHISRSALIPIKQIDLLPLTNADSQTLIEHLLKIENLPVATRHLILSKAEGNPFFLEEFLRSLIDAGLVLLKEDGQATLVAGAIQQLEVPNTLQSIIAARIDHLPPAEKHALQTASVIGRTFHQAVLEYMLRDQHAAVVINSYLSDLQQRELIRRRPTNIEFIFKHAVTQDVTYESLLIAHRKTLHHVTAQAIEALFPDQLEELSATLAYHYQKAEAHQQAVHYLLLAAERACSTYSNSEALAFYHSALQEAHVRQQDQVHYPAHESIGQIQVQLGHLLTLIGQYPEARVAYQQALASTPATDHDERARIYRLLGNNWMAQRDTDQALAAYTDAEAALGSPPIPADSHWLQAWLEIQLDEGWLYYWLGQVAPMQKLVDQIRVSIEEHGTALQRSRFYTTNTLMLFRRDHYTISDEIITMAELALTAAIQSQSRSQESFAAFILGFTYLWRGDLERADQALQSALELARQIGDMEHIVLNLTYLTITARRRGQIELMQSYCRQSLEAATRAAMATYIGVAKANQAWLAWQTGDMPGAKQLANEALAFWGQLAYPFPWLARWPLLLIALTEADLAQAITHAVGLCQPHLLRQPVHIDRLLEQAISAWQADDRDRATNYLLQAAEIAQAERLV